MSPNIFYLCKYLDFLNSGQVTFKRRIQKKVIRDCHNLRDVFAHCKSDELISQLYVLTIFAKYLLTFEMKPIGPITEIVSEDLRFGDIVLFEILSGSTPSHKAIIIGTLTRIYHAAIVFNHNPLRIIETTIESTPPVNGLRISS